MRDSIMGKIALPDQATMEADPIRREAEEDALEDDYACIRYQGDYVQELIDETDYPSFDVEAANQAFFEWKKHKKKNIMEFRNHGYTSPMTGKKGPGAPHPVEGCAGRQSGILSANLKTGLTRLAWIALTAQRLPCGWGGNMFIPRPDPARCRVFFVG